MKMPPIRPVDVGTGVGCRCAVPSASKRTRTLRLDAQTLPSDAARIIRIVPRGWPSASEKSVVCPSAIRAHPFMVSTHIAPSRATVIVRIGPAGMSGSPGSGRNGSNVRPSKMERPPSAPIHNVPSGLSASDDMPCGAPSRAVHVLWLI